MLARPSTIDFEALFGASPNPYVLLAPDLTIVTMRCVGSRNPGWRAA